MRVCHRGDPIPCPPTPTHALMADLRAHMPACSRDAFPWLKRAGLWGETIAAAMVHFGIKGLERSVANTWVLCLIKGDDGALE